jgi:hypothetical protein
MEFKKTVISILLGVCAASAADYTAWLGKKDVVLNTSASGANVAGTVTNFPVLIRLGASESGILTGGGANGSGIRFSKADNTTALPYQIESWSSTAAAIWVKVDSIHGNNSSQKIVLHYNNPGTVPSESNGPAVFDTANGFRGVWHLGSDSVGVSKDATNNRNHATQQGVATATQGNVGGARLFNAAGGGDIDTVGINPTFDMSVNDRLTVSAWVRRAGSNGAGSAFEGIAGVFDWNRGGTGVNNRMYSLVHNANNGFSFHVSSTGGDGANEIIVNSGIMAEANWTHAAATVDGTNIKVYVNGVSAMQTAYTGNIYFPASLTGVGPFTIGMLDDNGSGEGQYFNGGIDEVRLSGVARSADWLKLEYENQKTLNTLANIGLPVAPGAPTNVTAVNSGAPGSVLVSWTAPTNNGGTDITGYKAYLVSDTAKSCTSTGLSCSIAALTGNSLTFEVRAINAVGRSVASQPSSGVTGIASGSLVFNVGNFTKAYAFQLPENVAGVTALTLSISDVTGKTVWSKTINPSRTQTREIGWNGLTAKGAKVASGLYIARVKTNGSKESVQAGIKLRQD